MSHLKSIGMSVLALSFLAPQCFAGNEGSGGGNAIVCFDSATIASQIKVSRADGGGYIEDKHIPHITSVELLDIHKAKLGHLNDEGEIVYAKIIDSEPGENQKQYLERISRRIESMFPRFREYIDAGKMPVKGFPNGLAPIDDVNSGEVFKANCVRSTIIAQFDEAGKTYAAVDSRIYSLSNEIFPVSSRALSFWHEYLYRLARIYNKAKTSDAVQSLIGAFITEDVTIGEILLKMAAATGTKTRGFEIKPFYQDLIDNLNQDLEKSNLRKIHIKKNFIFKPSINERDRVFKNGMEPFTDKVLQIYLSEYQHKLLSMKAVSRETLENFDNFIQNSWIKKFGYRYPSLHESCDFLDIYYSCDFSAEYYTGYYFYSVLDSVPKDQWFDAYAEKLPNRNDF